jgi:hypothetical protein
MSRTGHQQIVSRLSGCASHNCLRLDQSHDGQPQTSPLSFAFRELGPEFPEPRPTKMHRQVDPIALKTITDDASVLGKRLLDGLQRGRLDAEDSNGTNTEADREDPSRKAMQLPTLVPCPFCLATGERLIEDAESAARPLLPLRRPGFIEQPANRGGALVKAARPL